ncbi:hypothetical protein P3T76_007908 [Phytophthora citrophthora]|uniref:Uncharacterized protein n=1 Tax=Phytophthora citrophthora TaxID=4793 RepID=A0AAD9GL29_9STRA|nr:hypothetical protein P3T76_007908 [Phytophthora citrophthora]
MVYIGMWGPLLLSLWCLPRRFATSISIIERDVEPTVFVTTAATSDKEPIWLVVPMLLDVQPVLFKVDVMQHVPAQIQSFCREHGVDDTRCASAIREALDEVVDWQHFCKKPVVESALPGFVVTKHVIREDDESASTLWLQNDPKDIATDFCGFAQAKTGESSGTCVEALEQTLQLSFDWMLALSPCEQQTDSVISDNSGTLSVADRLAAVEEMIAALQSTSEIDMSLTTEVETTEEVPGAVEEIGEDESGENVGADAAPSNDFRDWEEERRSTSSTTNDELEDAPKQLTVIQEADITTNVADQDDLVADNISSEVLFSTPLDQRLSRIGEEKEAQKGTALTTQEESMENDFGAAEETSATETEENIGVYEVDAVHLDDVKEQTEDGESLTSDVAEQGDHVQSEFTPPNAEGSLMPPLNKRQSVVNDDKEVQKSWKIGVALVLALSILYLVIDLMLHCVRYLASRIKAPKQIVSVLLHDILVLVGTGPRSKLKNKGDKLKKSSSRQAQAPSSEETPQISTDTNDKPLQPQVTVPHPLTSFTCAAMLVTGCISIDSIPLAQDTPTTPSVLQDSNEALAIIQQKYDRELAAAQRIQNAWKAAQRKSLLKREWERVFNGICMVESSSVAAASPNKTEVQQPPALRRLMSNILPPL